MVGGSTLAFLGFAETSGPSGAVRGYFAALARSDAPAALSFGDVPAGPHDLLTSPVLRVQQRIAPLRDFAIATTHRQGKRASVSVRYVLGYERSPQTVNTTIAVHETGDGWRLDAVALATRLDLDRAADRATVAGAAIPDGTALLFPGAVPVTFDSPYLQLNAAEDSVGLGGHSSTLVYVEVSPAGRAAVIGSVRATLNACLSGRGDVTCPQPNDRYVPGTLRGRLSGDPSDNVEVSLGPEDAGVLRISGEQPVRATTFRRLSFRNRAESGSGIVVLDLAARAYAVSPLRLTWGAS